MTVRSDAAPKHARHAHPALFALLVMPFGFVVGYSDVALSYLFRERGLTEELVGVVVFAVGLPHTWKFLWAPALDAGTKRRTWYLASVTVAALALAGVALIPPDPDGRIGPLSKLEAYCLLLLVAQAAVATSTAAIDALMALTIPKEKKGAVAGWSMAGNVGGTAIGGALIAYVTQHSAPEVAAVLFFVICFSCGLPALFLREAQPVRHPVMPAMKNLFKDVWALLRSREGWTGVLICLSPVGAGAAVKHFGGLAKDYVSDESVREFAVEFVNGIGGGLIGAAGCLIGGYLADRMNRRVSYVLAGALTALAAVGMALGPADTYWTLDLGEKTLYFPITYTLGCLGYQLANGIAYAAFAAFVLEMIGEGPGVTTKYTLFVGASNLAISYVGLLDGLGHGWGQAIFPGKPWAGRVGTLGVDVIATVAGIVVVLTMLAFTRKKRVVPAAL